MDFYAASREAAGTKRRVRYKKGDWHRYEEMGDHAVLFDSPAKKDWWPTSEQAKEKVWEIEPEKPEEIIVWVVNENGIDCIYGCCPQKYGEDTIWSIPDDSETDGCIELESNLFPKDKPMEYVLIKKEEYKRGN